MMGRFDVGQPSWMFDGACFGLGLDPGNDHTRGVLLSPPKSRISTSGLYPLCCFWDMIEEKI
jgi:hypothetical protein